MSVCSHIWGVSGSINLLDRVKSKVIRLPNSPNLISKFDSLALRYNVVYLSVFYGYCTAFSSRKVATCVPPPIVRPCSTQRAIASHDYCVAGDNSGVSRCDVYCFFPCTVRYPAHVFSNSHDLSLLKRQVSHFLINS